MGVLCGGRDGLSMWANLAAPLVDSPSLVDAVPRIRAHPWNVGRL
jgi:hypothetical protein